MAVRLRLVACCILLVSPAVASPQSIQKKAPPPIDLKAIGTGAVIDLSKTAVGALFEAKVLAGTKLTWVERTQVDKVLGELELQALFSAEGGSSRAGLGKLLKADMLILLRAGENPEDKKSKHLEIVICETQRGLRLAGQAVPITTNADADLEQLQSIVNGALAKLSEKITDVCAVPPFLNQDLDFQFDYLKAAYARVLEQHLLQRKGVLVVELAEAKALAKEAFLSGKETKLERRLPLYFLGTFRNEGKDGARRMELELKLQRGESSLGIQQKGRVVPSETPKELSKLADVLSAKVLAADEVGTADPNAEIAQLLARARAFEQLGNWSECLALIEAALLLDADQPTVHHWAARTCGLLVRRNIQKALKFPEEFITALNHHRRAVEHMEFGWTPSEKKTPPQRPNYGYLPISNEYIFAMGEIHNLIAWKPAAPERTALWTLVKKEEQAAYLRVCRVRAHAGVGGECSMLYWAVHRLADKEKYEIMRDMIVELKDLPFAKERTIHFAKQNHVVVEDAGFPAFIDDLARNAHPQIKAAGEYLQKDHAKQMAILKARQPVVPKLNPRGDVDYQPVNFTLRGAVTGKTAPFGLIGCQAIGPDLDIIVGYRGIYLMKEKGILTPIWEANEPNARANRFCYDGRYIWFSVERLRKVPRLFVLNPQEMELTEITAADGLPLVDPESLPDRGVKQLIDVAPLGPGRACLAGSFGRSWLAMATFDPEAGKTIKVFHEAREAPEGKAPDQWKRSTIAFEPGCMFTIASAQGVRRVLIGRKCSDFNVESHPLIVDPDALKVDVMKDIVYTTNLQHAQVRDGTIYYLADGKPENRHLLKIAFPGTERKSLMAGLPDGRMVLTDDDFHIATESKGWWHGSLAKENARPVGFMAPGHINFMGSSAHYGVLVQQTSTINENGNLVKQFNRIYQVAVSPK